MAPDSERISNVDTAWWHMEDPTNLMMITSVMIMQGELDYERVRRTVKQRLLKFDRFRQRIVEPRFGSPRWELDPHFDLDAHMFRVALPQPGDKATLEAYVSDLMSMPLDYSKPLWQFHVVESFEDGFAFVSRLHHCIADGIALMRVLLSLTDDSPEAILEEEQPPAEPRGRSLVGTLVSPARRAVTGTRKVGGRLLDESLNTLQNPGRLADAARLGLSGTARLGQIAVRLPDPPTLFKGGLGTRKRAAWSATLPLADVKAVGRVTGGTVNDVLVTAISGALRRYLESHTQGTEDLNFRAYIPVNLRPPDEPLRLGNKFGLVFLSLPVGIVDQVERLNEVKRRMDELKSSTEALVAITLLSTAGMMPKDIEQALFSFFHTKATLVLTNVPGPQQPLYMGGSKLKYMMGWVPQSGKLGLGISIISYNGEVAVGVNTDAGLVPDPDLILRYFDEEFAELMTLVENQSEDNI